VVVVTSPSPDNPEIARALREVVARIDGLHADLLVDYPALRETMAIPGTLLGHGLGSLVANGMTNDQIVAHVLSIVAEIRQKLAEIQSASSIASRGVMP
jgi:hypothetical protein